MTKAVENCKTRHGKNWFDDERDSFKRDIEPERKCRRAPKHIRIDDT